MCDLEQKIKNLPEQPGVYIMRDKTNEIIYVGKAKILKNRVRQYFNNNNHPPKVAAMISNIADFEYIIADSELEALVLENNLIKEHMPKYNILLKDDKTYPFIKVTLGEEYPSIYMTRQVKRDGSRYFGPYQSSQLVKEVIELIKEIFKLKYCNKVFEKNFKPKKPCLYYHIGKCNGICSGNVSVSEYREIINNVCKFLNGKYDDVLKQLNAQMNDAVKRLDFEKASIFRDRIAAVEQLGNKQKIVTANGTDIDAISLYNESDICCIEIFFIRNGNIIGKEHYFINETSSIPNGDILSQFIRQYYDDSSFIPKELLVCDEIEDSDILKVWLSSKCIRTVDIRCPKIGKYSELIKMITINAKKEHEEYILKRMKSNDFVNNSLSQLMKYTCIDKPPMYIEAYDISNISGSANVGSMVTFKNGKPFKQGYRNFKIKSVSGQNDYGSMYEVLTRRFEKYKLLSTKNSEDTFAVLPDILFVDGGMQHVLTATKVIEEQKLNVPVFGIVKDNTHSTRGLVSISGEIPIDDGSDAFMLLTNIQDEMHRRAISYHRSLMNKQITESKLTDITGVGDKKKKILLNEFKTFSAIKNASMDQLLKVKGIDKITAKNIYEYFNGEDKDGH